MIDKKRGHDFMSPFLCAKFYDLQILLSAIKESLAFEYPQWHYIMHLSLLSY